MIEKSKIVSVITPFLEENKFFLVDISVGANNNIVILIDSMDNIPISKCVELNRVFEANFDRDVEDFELEVSSAGISRPFKVIQQYQKNIGKMLEITLKDGNKIEALLQNVNENEISIETKTKKKIEGKKKKELVVENKTISFDEIKSTVNLIVF